MLCGPEWNGYFLEKSDAVINEILQCRYNIFNSTILFFASTQCRIDATENITSAFIQMVTQKKAIGFDSSACQAILFL